MFVPAELYWWRRSILYHSSNGKIKPLNLWKCGGVLSKHVLIVSPKRIKSIFSNCTKSYFLVCFFSSYFRQKQQSQC